MLLSLPTTKAAQKRVQSIDKLALNLYNQIDSRLIAIDQIGGELLKLKLSIISVAWIGYDRDGKIQNCSSSAFSGYGGEGIFYANLTEVLTKCSN